METNIKLKQVNVNASIKKFEIKTSVLGYGNRGLPGKEGPHYTPQIDDEGNLSWTNNGNLPNPEVVNIRGPQGIQGQEGKQGPEGPQGIQGPVGPSGQDGKDGVSITTISSGEPTQQNDYTITPITFNKSDGSNQIVNVSAKNGLNGGGAGVSDYPDLTNKPRINSVELVGNKTLTELGIQPKGNYITSESDPTVPSHVKNIKSTDITNWNNKSDFSGNYNDLTNKPAPYELPVASDTTLGGVKITTSGPIGNADGYLYINYGVGLEVDETTGKLQANKWCNVIVPNINQDITSGQRIPFTAMNYNTFGADIQPNSDGSITFKKAGFYKITVHVWYYSDEKTNRPWLQLYKNVSLIAQTIGSNSDNYITQEISNCIVEVQENDYIFASYTYCGANAKINGGSNTTASYITIEQLII